VENGTVKMRGNKITILSIQNVYKYNLLHQITAVGIDDQNRALFPVFKTRTRSGFSARGNTVFKVGFFTFGPPLKNYKENIGPEGKA
jgi:hypothetical protein